MKGKTAGKGKGAEKDRSPVVQTARRVIRLLLNKVIGSLMLLGQGILFLVSPSGDVTPTIRISAGMVILVCLIVFFSSYGTQEKKQAGYSHSRPERYPGCSGRIFSGFPGNR